MTDTEFHQLVDKVMNKIEEQLDQYDGNNDIDCETHGSIMTLTFENDSKLLSTAKNHSIKYGELHGQVVTTLTIKQTIGIVLAVIKILSKY